MSRQTPDWIQSFLEYTSYNEAPKRVFFWVAVSVIAGALRRKLWIDMGYFKWYPNFYIFIVGDPGIIKKSTTAGVGMKLLRQVPDIKFGPDAVTWQSLVSSLAESGETYDWTDNDGVVHTFSMSPLTIMSSEAGNLLNPQDREMIDLLVSLWDGLDTFEKRTKMSGNDTIHGPWINLIACTTPAWIAGNVPEYMVGGGFTSRCVFVYGKKPDRKVAYPAITMPPGWRAKWEPALVADLEQISKMKGEYCLTPEAIKWGTEWYERHHSEKHMILDDTRFGGYLARKQTHIHKLAMVLAAAKSDELLIHKDDLINAAAMVNDLEADMPEVFARIGKSVQSNIADRFVEYVERHGAVSYHDAYRWLHAYFPASTDMEGLVAGAIRAGLVEMRGEGTNLVLSARKKKIPAA